MAGGRWKAARCRCSLTRWCVTITASTRNAGLRQMVQLGRDLPDPAGIRQYYSEALTGLKDPKDLEVDAVSGATVSAQHFAALWQALQTPMKKGETDPVTVADIPEFSPAASTDE